MPTKKKATTSKPKPRTSAAKSKPPTRAAKSKPPTRAAKPNAQAATTSSAELMDTRVQTVIASLKRAATKHTRDGMTRYGIPNDKAFGVSVGTLRKLAKQLAPDHDLALALWTTGWYEARMLAAFVDDPARVTPAQMDRWCRDFDNWALCDTVCFHLFDRTPHAFDKVERWSERRPEFEKRASFALLASLAGHDKQAGDAAFTGCFPLIEKAAEDERNFVKKAVSWALRRIGSRNPPLHAAALALAHQLAKSSTPSTRWIGKDTVRDLSRPQRKREK